jgi:putative hemolysin
MPHVETQEPFQIRFPDHGNLKSRLLQAIEPSLSKILCLEKLNAIYAGISDEARRTDFLSSVLEAMNIGLDVHDCDLARIPKEGPCVVVANHPFGAVEGVVLGAMLRKVRPDVKLMANYLLAMIPEMREHIISVDPFGTGASAKNNISGLKQCLRWVRGGGLLAIFPAGEVSSYHLTKRAVTDPKWSPTVGRIIRMTKAPVVPVYFAGANRPLFHLLGLIHPSLRTVMLPREMLNRQRRNVSARIGNPITHGKLADMGDDTALTEYLRLRTYVLGYRCPGTAESQADCDRKEPIHAPVARETLLSEIAALPEKSRLFESDEYLVAACRGDESPGVLKEIGRLREKCFREVGEGTGRALDLDRFDEHYEHLVLWNKKKTEIAGAYRLGRVDEILDRFGTKGLYTATLFKFKKRFLRGLGPALEMGRAFVCSEYQRSYFALMLLWKGIGAYVAANPRYRVLFGPVSISNDYQPLSRNMMMRFLSSHHGGEPSFLKPIKPKNPPKLKSRAPGGLGYKAINMLLKDVEDLSGAISEIEADGKGVPVLIRQYLKLGGRVLTFNVDQDFGDAIDGLMLVDLTATPPRVLKKYMGAEGAKRFLSIHLDSESSQDLLSA